MPTEESRKKFLDWFKKYHPKEHYFFTTIESNLGKIYSSDNFGLRDGEYAQISLNIRKLGEDKYHIIADPFTAVFLGSICKTIMDEISNNMESMISEQIQQEFDNRKGSKCKNCDCINPPDARYCNQCGNLLESNKK